MGEKKKIFLAVTQEISTKMSFLEQDIISGFVLGSFLFCDSA